MRWNRWGVNRVSLTFRKIRLNNSTLHVRKIEVSASEHFNDFLQFRFEERAKNLPMLRWQWHPINNGFDFDSKMHIHKRPLVTASLKDDDASMRLLTMQCSWFWLLLMFKMENGFYWVDWKLHLTPAKSMNSGNKGTQGTQEKKLPSGNKWNLTRDLPSQWNSPDKTV